jgi:hypothetical protein
MKMVKLIFQFLLIILFAASCTENYSSSSDCEDPDYSNCDTYQPKYGQLIIKVDMNSENPAVPIAVYVGKIEDNSLYLLDTATSELYSISVDLDYYYSVKASYKSGNKTIIAIDGDDVKSKSYINCDSTCYSVHNGTADVRLKYQ